MVTKYVLVLFLSSVVWRSVCCGCRVALVGGTARMAQHLYTGLKVWQPLFLAPQAVYVLFTAGHSGPWKGEKEGQDTSGDCGGRSGLANRGMVLIMKVC